MSTANKLSYLNDTKSLLRTSLNKFGSSILSTDTFRSYDTKLNEIYDKLPKVTGSGSEFTLIPVQNGQVDDFKMNGVDLEQSETPTPDSPQEIKVVEGRQVITDKGKNLFDVSQTPHSDNITSAGVTLNINDDGTISTSGTNTETYRNIRYDIQLQAGEYIISGCPTGGSKNGYSSLVQLTNETSSQVFDTGSGATFSLQETTTVKFYPVRVGSDTVNFNGLIFKPMIRLSNISNDTFEPYYEPVSYNIDLQLENIYLAKMPNTTYKNRIYKNNGNWYFEENVRKYIIDGTESWTTQSAYSGYYRYMFVLMENYKNDNLSYGVVGMNSHFIQRITQPHGDYEYLYLQAANNNLLSVYIQIKNLSTIANFKTWLSENNVVVWYVLANPVTTQITNTTLINQLEAISVHTGTNIITISNDNNIIPEIEITRLKELEKLA